MNQTKPLAYTCVKKRKSPEVTLKHIWCTAQRRTQHRTYIEASMHTPKQHNTTQQTQTTQTMTPQPFCATVTKSQCHRVHEPNKTTRIYLCQKTQVARSHLETYLVHCPEAHTTSHLHRGFHAHTQAKQHHTANTNHTDYDSPTLLRNSDKEPVP